MFLLGETTQGWNKTRLGESTMRTDQRRNCYWKEREEGGSRDVVGQVSAHVLFKTQLWLLSGLAWPCSVSPGLPLATGSPQ